MSSFSNRIDTFLAEFFRLNPLAATAAGMHEHDHQWPDLTEAGRVVRLAFAERWASVFGAIQAGELDRDEAVDRALLLLVRLREGDAPPFRRHPRRPRRKA